jgi:hypothetical protein
MNDIASLQIMVNAEQPGQAAVKLDQLADSATQAEKATVKLSSATDILAAAAKYAASAFGLYKLGDMVKEATQLAARYETMGIVMQVAGNNAGYSRAKMDEFSKSLQTSGISMLQSRNSLTQLATAHIDLSKASELARAAQNLAVVANTNSSDALARMIQGIKSGEVEVLKTMGLNVQFAEGYKTLAKELGVNVNQLTEQQKTQARTNLVLQESASYAGIYEASLTTAGKAQQSLTRYFEDFKIMAGEAFLPILAEGVFSVMAAMKSLNAELQKTTFIKTVGQDLLTVFKLAVAAIEPALKIATVYFALFIAAPAIIAVVSTAFTALAGTLAVTAFNMLIVERNGLALNAMLYGTSVNAMLAAGSLTAMKLGLSVLMAAFAGWEIGTYLRENFVEAQLAGIAFVEGMLVAWENLKYGGQLAWLAIQSGFGELVSFVGTGMATILDNLSRGLRAVGLGAMADSLDSLSGKIKSATVSTTSFQQESGKLKSQLDSNVASVRAITGDMADEAQAHFNSAGATKKSVEEKIKDQTETGKQTELTKAQISALKKHEDQVKSLMSSIDEKIITGQAELGSVEKLSESEKIAIKITADLIAGTLDLNEAEMTEILTKLDSLSKIEQTITARARETKETAEATKAYADLIDTLQKGNDSTQEQIDKLRETNDTMLMSKEQLDQYKNQKLLDTAATWDQKAAWAEQNWLGQDLVDQYKRQASGLRELAGLKQQGVHVQAAKDAAVEWKRTTDSIAQGLGDSLIDSVENGKDTWLSFRDFLVGTFKNMVLSPVVNLIVNPIAGAINNVINGALSSITGGALGNTAGAGGGIASTLSAAGGVAGLVGTFGSSLAAGFSGTMAAGFTGLGATLSGGLSAIATGTSATMAAGLGQIVGALGPYALAAVAIYGLLGGFKGEYVKGAGSGTTSFDSSGKTTATNQFGNSFDFQTEAADKYVANLQKGYLTTAKALGIKNQGGSFAFGSNNSDGGKFGVNANVGSTNYSTTDIKITPEALSLEASRAIFAALQGSELPAYMAKVFDGITASTATSQQIDEALAYAGSLKQIRDALLETREPLQILKDNVAESLLALGTTAETFKSDFVAAIDSGIDSSTLTDWQRLGAGIEELTEQTGGAADAVERLAKTNANLQDKLDILTGKATSRSIELRDATDDSTRALLNQIYAQEDLKDATEAAADAAQVAADNWAKQTADALEWVQKQADKLADDRKTVDDLRNEATQNYISAQRAVTAAQQQVANALHGTIKTFQDVLDGLEGNGNPLESLAGSRQKFNDLSAAAGKGDTAALAALPNAAKEFLSLSKGFSSSRVDYQKDQAVVRNTLSTLINQGGDLLKKLPVEMQQASDPLKDAYAALAKATAEENTARNLAVAMQAELRTSEKTLGERYLDAIKALPEGEELKTFYDSTFAAVEAAAAIAKAAASAAVEILAGLTKMPSGGGAGPALGGGGGPPANIPKVDTGGLITEDTGPTELDKPKFDKGALIGGTITPGNSIQAGADSYQSTLAYTGYGEGGNSADIFKSGYARLYTDQGVQYTTSEYIARLLDTVAKENGKEAAIFTAGRYGLSGAGLDLVRNALPGASFAVGTNYVPRDMVAQIHEGEAIIPAAFNPERFGAASGNDALVSEIRALRAEVKQLREDNSRENNAIITPTNKTARLIERVMPAGDALQTRAIT